MDVQNMFAIMEWPTDGHKLSIHHLKFITEPVKSWNSFQPGDEGMSRYPGSRDLWPFKILAVGASRKSLQPTVEKLLKQMIDSEVSEENVLEQQSDMDKENEDVPQKTKNKRTRRVPGPVRNLRAEAYGTTYVLLKWLPPDQPNGLLIGYDIGYQKVDGLRLGNIMALKPQISNPSTLGARITGLHANNSYRFFVWARTKTGRGDNYYVEVRTADGEPPALPRFRVSQVHENHVNLTWSSPRKQDLHYYLQYREIGHSKWVATDSEWERSWKLIENLQPGTMYEVQAVARNRLGDMTTSIRRVVNTPQRDFDSQYISSNRLLENYNSATSIASWSFNIASMMCTLTMTTLAVSMTTLGTTTVFH